MSLKSYIKSTADPVFSRYIRLKAADRDGYCTCVTCGVVKRWNEGIQAGHYVGRRHWSTRFDDRNVHPQCVSCNKFNSGRIPRYTLYLMDVYNEGILGELVEKSRLVKLLCSQPNPSKTALLDTSSVVNLFLSQLK